MTNKEERLPTLVTKIDTLPKLSTRQQVHLILGRGIILLDRLHFTGWRDMEADDYSVLYEVPKQLQVPHSFNPDTGRLWVSDEERTEILRTALREDSAIDALRTASSAANTLDRVISTEIDKVEPVDFYTAQDVVRLVWQATLPTEFQGE